MHPRVRNLVLRLAYLAMLCPAGCAIFAPVAPGHDPVLVKATSAYEASFETVHALLTLEKANQAFVKEHLPAVHAFCQDVRKDARSPDGGVFVAAERAIDLYRHLKKQGVPSEDAKADLKARLRVVSELAAKARHHLAEAHGRGLK